MRIAISMIRDEADIIRHTLNYMLKQVDHAIIADNGSVDGSREILESFGDSVTIVDDPDVGYLQDVKMTRLAHRAGDMGATWVFPFDADEAWTLPLHQLDHADVVQMRSFVFLPNPDDENDPNPLKRLSHRMLFPEPLPKVCFRYHPNARLHMGNHGVNHPGPTCVSASGMRHYQYRSLDQVKRKVRQGTQAYEATDLPPMYGAHWRQLAALTDGALEHWWNEYVSQPVIHDPWTH